MADEVRIEINGTSADAQQAWLQLGQVVDKIVKKVDQLGKGVRKNQQDIDGAMTKSEKALAGMVNRFFTIQAGINGVRQAARLLIGEVQAAQNVRGKAYQQQYTTASAVESLMFNFGKSGGQANAIVNEVIKSSKGINFSDAMREMVSALSTRGAVKEIQAKEVAKTVWATRPGLDSDERSKVITAVLSTLRAVPQFEAKSGSEADLKDSARRATAFVMQALTAAPQSEVGKFSDNLVAGMLNFQNAAKEQDDPRFLMSLLIGLGQTSADRQGMRTRNAFGTFQQIMTDLKGAGVLDMNAGFETMFKTIQTDAQARAIVNKRLGVYGITPEAMRQKMSQAALATDANAEVKLRGEASMMSALLQVFQMLPDSTFWKEQQKAFNQIPTNDMLVPALEGLQKELRSSEHVQAFRAGRAVDFVEQQMLQNPAMALRHMLTKELEEMSVVMGGSKTVSDIRGFFGSTAPLGTQQEEMDRLIAWVQDQQRTIRNSVRDQVFEGPTGQGVIPGEPLDANDRQNLEMLEMLLNEFRGMRQDMADRDNKPDPVQQEPEA